MGIGREDCLGLGEEPENGADRREPGNWQGMRGFELIKFRGQEAEGVPLVVHHQQRFGVNLTAGQNLSCRWQEIRPHNHRARAGEKRAPIEAGWLIPSFRGLLRHGVPLGDQDADITRRSEDRLSNRLILPKEAGHSHSVRCRGGGSANGAITFSWGATCSNNRCIRRAFRAAWLRWQLLNKSSVRWVSPISW